MRLIPIFILVFYSNLVIANSDLTTCKGPNKSTWNNCFGDITYVNGDHYVGEWKDGKRHGQGTLYLAEPKISNNQANPVSGEKMYKAGLKMISDMVKDLLQR